MIDMTKAESLALLEVGRVGHLGMVGPDERPYTIPLRYVWHEGAVYVRLSYDGRKQDAISYLPKVCFEADEYRRDFSYYASVIVEGTIADVNDDEEKRNALVAFNDKYKRLSGLPSPGPHPVTHGVALRKIVVEQLAGRKSEPMREDPVPPVSRRSAMVKAR
jgi:nitroimidazol reductase NimA-like FMN-containing flavoprotein (pyridoxamine 5'-phosphate oxidase superfamily)